MKTLLIWTLWGSKKGIFKCPPIQYTWRKMCFSLNVMKKTVNKIPICTSCWAVQVPPFNISFVVQQNFGSCKQDFFLRKSCGLRFCFFPVTHCSTSKRSKNFCAILLLVIQKWILSYYPVCVSILLTYRLRKPPIFKWKFVSHVYFIKLWSM